jgi:hypothetical protein
MSKLTQQQFENLREAHPFASAHLRLSGVVPYSATPGSTNAGVVHARRRATQEPEPLPDGLEPVVDEQPFAGASHRQRIAALSPERQAAIAKLAGDDVGRQAEVLAAVAPAWEAGQ